MLLRLALICDRIHLRLPGRLQFNPYKLSANSPEARRIRITTRRTTAKTMGINIEFSEQIVGKVEIELENIGPADECEPGVSRGCVQHPGETRVLSSLGIGPLFFSII